MPEQRVYEHWAVIVEYDHGREVVQYDDEKDARAALDKYPDGSWVAKSEVVQTPWTRVD